MGADEYDSPDLGVGRSLGAAVWVELGSADGSALSLTVGRGLGEDDDGTTVGIVDGAELGNEDGDASGVDVGSALGDRDGKALGRWLGAALGGGEGAALGCRVETGLGSVEGQAVGAGLGREPTVGPGDGTLLIDPLARQTARAGTGA